METITRNPDWLARLHDHCDSWADRPFAFGSVDCFQFVAAGIDAMTGTNIMAGIEYNTLADAKRMLTRGATIDGTRHKGPKTSHAFWRHFLGAPKPASMAQRGDVVLFMDGLLPYSGTTHDGRPIQIDVPETLHVPGLVGASGRQVWIMTTDDGLAVFDVGNGATAWSV